MYLLSQMVLYLFLTFMLGVAVGYLLWQTWGQRTIVAKYNAAELRLANLLAEWQEAGGRPANPTQGSAAATAESSFDERIGATARAPFSKR